MGRRLGCQPTSGPPVASRAESNLLDSRAVLRNYFFQHRESILASSGNFPGFGEIKVMALRSE